MGLIIKTAIGVFGAVLLSFLARDLYACAPRFQRMVLKLAARLMPAASREEVYNQWYGDLMAMPPSELLRTMYAFDCVRGGITLGFRSKKNPRANSLFSGAETVTHSDWEALLQATSGNGSKAYDVMKRATDIFASSLYLLAVAPWILVLTIAVKLESGGPAIYRDVRIGKDGKPFGLYRFRTLLVDSLAPYEKSVTRVGRFLRASRMDEILQMINVLKGEMSFIGPRPERQRFVKMVGQAIPHYHLRHNVKPGITGWAQVNNVYSAANLEDIKNTLYCDVYYTKHRNFWMDLKIMFRTVWVVLGPKPKWPPE